MAIVLATLVVVAHVIFVVFVVFGGLLTLYWRRVLWVHLPAAVWGSWIELSGGVCPLTPLENDLRARAGLAPYEGDFIARWVFPVLYPEGLTRDLQVVLGTAVIALNAVVYAIVFRRAWRRRPRIL